MRFSENCFEKYINPLAILLCIIIIITLICLNLIYPHLESIFWPLILVVSIYLSINFMIYYVIFKNRQKAKKRIVPGKRLKTNTVNSYSNNNSTESINILTRRMKKQTLWNKKNTYRADSAMNPYLPV